MVFEVELKAHLTDPAATEVRVAELGTFKGETSKEDVYFRQEVWPVRYRFVDDRTQPWPFVEAAD